MSHLDSIETDYHDDEYARRIREEVLYMQREEVDDDEVDDDEVERYDEEDLNEEEIVDVDETKAKRPQCASMLWLLFTGNILVIKGFTKYYGQMMILASLFFVSIGVMFWSLHLDMEYSDLTRDVQLLRERSIRLEELRYSKCSHSAIVEELERRGIDLVDPTTPAIVIERRGLW